MPATPGAGGTPPARPVATPAKEGIKETIESILVAFILAFVFRAFVVEAFVIPSGSMAPTLLGGHMRYRCERCGYQFDVNYPADTSRDENLSIPSRSGPRVVEVGRRGPDGMQYTRPESRATVFSMHCPNCGLKVRRDHPDPEQSASNSPVYFGDRILVLKYLYLLQDPARWDVVVFKSPTDPQIHDYGQNFIKRLVGRPGETLMVLDGDVYVCPNDKAGTGAVEQWPWQVQSKPRVVQDALWRVIYDNDFRPAHPNGWKMPWQEREGTGWQTGGEDGKGRVLKFENMQGSGTLFFNKDANSGTFPFTDWLPYNETKIVRPEGDHFAEEAYEREQIPRWYVSDLKVQFFYDRKSGEGPLVASLSRLGHVFRAELHPGLARLVHRLPTGESRVVQEAKLDVSGGRPLQVEFTNVDYQVTLWVNGKKLIQTTAQEYGPDVGELLALHRKRNALYDQNASREAIRSVFGPPTVELIAEKQACDISHLSLWRDIYYTPGYDYSGVVYKSNGPSDRAHGSPENPIRLHRKGDRVGEDAFDNEYFVLGDNSILSSDARAWGDPVRLKRSENLVAEPGRVPERFLLGKAFFVYWPAGYRPLSLEAPGLVPNFGDMRFIH